MAKAKRAKIIKPDRYSDGTFFQIPRAGASKALKLTANGLRLYMVLNDNRNGFVFDLSPAGIVKKYDEGISLDIAKGITSKGVPELIGAGFMRQVSEDDYEFNPVGFESENRNEKKPMEPSENSSEKTDAKNSTEDNFQRETGFIVPTREVTFKVRH